MKWNCFIVFLLVMFFSLKNNVYACGKPTAFQTGYGLWNIPVCVPKIDYSCGTKDQLDFVKNLENLLDCDVEDEKYKVLENKLKDSNITQTREFDNVLYNLLPELYTLKIYGKEVEENYNKKIKRKSRYRENDKGRLKSNINNTTYNSLYFASEISLKLSPELSGVITKKIKRLGQECLLPLMNKNRKKKLRLIGLSEHEKKKNVGLKVLLKIKMKRKKLELGGLSKHKNKMRRRNKK